MILQNGDNMKLLVLVLILTLILATAQTANAPRGAWYSKVRVIETSGGTVTEMVRYYREVREVTR